MGFWKDMKSAYSVQELEWIIGDIGRLANTREYIARNEELQEQFESHYRTFEDCFDWELKKHAEAEKAKENTDIAKLCAIVQIWDNRVKMHTREYYLDRMPKEKLREIALSNKELTLRYAAFMEFKGR